MPALFNRRNFLTSTGAIWASTVTAGMNACAVTASAIEPVRRSGPHKFKFSLAAYSYRDLLQGKMQPKLTLEDFIRDCAKLQLEGTELTSYYFPSNPSGEYLRNLKHLAFTLGLDISGTAVGNDFCIPPGEQRQRQIESVKRWIDYAEILGAPVIRIFSGKTGKGQDPADAHRLAVQGMEECCSYAGEHGVVLALENHGGLTDTAEGMLKLVHDVKSPWFGVNLDSGNFRTDDPYGELEKIAPYAVNVQIKVVVSPKGGTKQPADFKRLAKMLRDVGYRGYVVLEFEEAGDPREECGRYLEELRAAFA